MMHKVEDLAFWPHLDSSLFTQNWLHPNYNSHCHFVYIFKINLYLCWRNHLKASTTQKNWSFITFAYGIQMPHSLVHWNLLSLPNKKEKENLTSLIIIETSHSSKKCWFGGTHLHVDTRVTTFCFVIPVPKYSTQVLPISWNQSAWPVFNYNSKISKCTVRNSD